MIRKLRNISTEETFDAVSTVFTTISVMLLPVGVVVLIRAIILGMQ